MNPNEKICKCRHIFHNVVNAPDKCPTKGCKCIKSETPPTRDNCDEVCNCKTNKEHLERNPRLNQSKSLTSRKEQRESSSDLDRINADDIVSGIQEKKSSPNSPIEKGMKHMKFLYHEYDKRDNMIHATVDMDDIKEAMQIVANEVKKEAQNFINKDGRRTIELARNELSHQLNKKDKEIKSLTQDYGIQTDQLVESNKRNKILTKEITDYKNQLYSYDKQLQTTKQEEIDWLEGWAYDPHVYIMWRSGQGETSLGKNPFKERLSKLTKGKK